MPLRSLLPILILIAFMARAAGVDPVFDKQVMGFLDEHCLECHGDGVTKGGLDLTKIGPGINATEHINLWTRIYDRVSKGEMPPSKRPRPAAAPMKAMLDWIAPRLTEADRKQREVVLRRLNREEYQNTIRDLLRIEVDVKDLLPEDQSAGGFDNNGEALALSTEQMQRYLEAARLAIDEAIVTGPRPKTETHVVDSLHEVQRYIDSGQFGFVDGRVVAHTTSDTTYSKISTRKKRTPVRGRYRFKFQAAAHNSLGPLFFTVTASDFANVSAVYKNLGYFEVGPEPRTFEIESVLGAKQAIQFFALGLPGYLKKPAEGHNPGVGFGEVEITGPLYDQWPPASHAELIGDVDLAKGTVADAEKILRRFLPRAFRRSASDADVQRYLDLVKSRLDEGRSFDESIRVGLVAVLCSPQFLYMREDVNPNSSRVSDFELASRLSYFLWSSMPDEELMRLAGAGRLHDSKVLAQQVERMLKDLKSERFVTNFTGQWLKLRQINETTPDQKLYKKFDELLQVSMVWEGESFFRQLLEENLNIDHVIDSDFAVLNQRLAEHYGVQGIKGLAMRKVKLPEGSVRGGVLTQAGVLKVTANGTNTSPVTRGVWVLENILGEPTPPPPPTISGIEPDIRGATTIREQLEKHRADDSCNACHRTIDPPGFALESFDPIGDFRESYLRFVVTNAEKGWGRVQAGAPVDASGKLATGEPFQDIRDFKRLLMKRRDAFAHCMAEKLMAYGLGRHMGFSDRPAIAAVVKETAARGNGLRTLVHVIIQSETFRTR